MAPQLGWIGLGNMGMGMVKNMVEKAHLEKPLLIQNRTKSRANEFAAQLPAGKTKVVSTPAELTAACDIIFTMLGDDKSIIDCVNDIVKADIKGKLIVDCTTVHPATASELNKAITAKGAHFVACPVFGAPAMAQSGQLVCVLAGPQADIDKVIPYTKGVVARDNIVFADQDPGKALTMKVIGNTMVLQMVESLGEAHTVAEKTGLGTKQLHDFISAIFPGPYTAYSNRMLAGDHVRDAPLFHVDLALKDARHGLDLAAKSGTKMRALEVVQQHLLEVKEDQGAKGDLAGVYGAVRKESGLPFDNK